MSQPGPTAHTGEADPALALASLTQLEQRARACADEAALAFVMVNETHAVSGYRQAVLWLDEGSGGRLLALSGLALPDRQAPFNSWLARWLSQQAQRPGANRPGPLVPPPQTQLDDARMWREHLPAQGWWLPLRLTTTDPADPPASPQAALLLLRDAPWSSRETALLVLLADAYGHAWRALRLANHRRARSRSGRPPDRQRWLLAAGLVALACLALPVRQSVLAPAEVVARAPDSVRAPLQGVVDRIEVQPNQAVRAGQLLARLDARDLQGRLEAARQTLAVAEAEWRRGQQQALYDSERKAELGLLQGKRNQAAADAEFYAEALRRTQLRAERAGIALFDDPTDWIGKPVALGERIMQVADPFDAELEVQLPVADAIALPVGARVRLFLNATPTAPIDATVLRVGYRATPMADGTLAYWVRARFERSAQRPPRVGLKGTAKLYGERTLLAVYLLRRPLATARIWLGL